MPSEAYNGLGLRVGKTDSTGSYASVCDGTSPASPVLTDGHTLYTPGLSENKGGTSRYYANAQNGNWWTIDGSSQGQSYCQDTTGFGTLLGFSGSSSVFGYGGGNGCQSDVDTGLILMGHRYYDTRIGRFLSQDPAGDGDNWYAYADNSPTNNIDPTGLVIAGGGMGVFQDPTQAGTTYDPDNDADDQYYDGVSGEYNDYNAKTGAYIGSEWLGAAAFDQMNSSSMGPAMVASNASPLMMKKDNKNWLQRLLQGVAIVTALHTGHAHCTLDMLIKINQ